MNKPSFVVIDFETANNARHSACQVAVVRVENGEIVDRYNTLINLPVCENFIHTNIHGICRADLIGQPNFFEIFAKLKQKLEQKHIVLAHNACFDMSVLKSAMKKYGGEPFEFSYGCTLIMLRKFFPTRFRGYKLNEVAKTLDLNFKHHDAAEDTEVLAKIVLTLFKTQADFERVFNNQNGLVKSFWKYYHKVS